MLTMTGVGLVPYGIHHLGNGYAMHIQKNKDTHVLLTNRLGHTFKVMKRKVTSQSQKRFQKDFDHIMRLTQDKILNRAVLTYLKGGSFIDRKWTFDSVEKKPIIEDDPIREEAITIVNNVGYSKKRDIVVHTINSLISLNETIKGSKDIKDVMLYLIVSSNDTMMRWDFTMSNSGYTSSRTVVLHQVKRSSVLHQVNVFNDNILSLRKNIRKSEVEVNKINVKKPNYSEYEIVLYDQIEEMYVAISDLKNKICEIKHGQCVCFSDASSGPCKLYDV
jgi:hypothetical protein